MYPTTFNPNSESPIMNAHQLNYRPYSNCEFNNQEIAYSNYFQPCNVDYTAHYYQWFNDRSTFQQNYEYNSLPLNYNYSYYQPSHANSQSSLPSNYEPKHKISNEASNVQIAQISSKKCLKLSNNRKAQQMCEVCTDMASGFHYGAYSCEACKIFFIRTAKNKRKREIEKCPTKKCLMNVTMRSRCSSCRFDKCISIGMSVTGRSRFGRQKTIVNKQKQNFAK